MLDKGIIPDKEPIVRVGIHLPQDKSSTMTIEFPEPELFEITTNGSLISIQTELNLRVKDGYIDSGQGSNKNISKLSILRKDQCISFDHGPIIHSVFAGRGFHWQKKNISPATRKYNYQDKRWLFIHCEHGSIGTVSNVRRYIGNER